MQKDENIMKNSQISNKSDWQTDIWTYRQNDKLKRSMPDWAFVRAKGQTLKIKVRFKNQGLFESLQSEPGIDQSSCDM